MSLLWLDGFESYGTTIGGAPSPTGITNTKYLASSYAFHDIENGFEGKSLEASTGYFYTPYINVTDTNDTLIFGFHLYILNVSANRYTLVSFRSALTRGCSLILEGMELSFRDAPGAYTAATAIGLKSKTWYFIEMKATNHDTTGSYEIRVNDTNVLSGTGLDTKGTSLTYYNNVIIYGNVGYTTFDNLYICNGAGTVNNNFLGTLKVLELRPTSDSTTNFVTATPSAIHFENTEDEESDEDTSYNQGVSGEVEIYGYTTLTGLSSITGVVLDSRVKTTTGTDENFQHIIESGASQENSSNVTTNVTTFQTYTYPVELDPDTSSAWTLSGINAATFGVELQ